MAKWFVTSTLKMGKNICERFYGRHVLCFDERRRINSIVSNVTEVATIWHCFKAAIVSTVTFLLKLVSRS